MTTEDHRNDSRPDHRLLREPVAGEGDRGTRLETVLAVIRAQNGLRCYAEAVSDRRAVMRRCSGRRFPVAFGMVFLDESGHFNSTDYMCMAGFIATDQGWGALCGGWRVLLRETYKIPAIHMLSLIHI